MSKPPLLKRTPAIVKLTEKHDERFWIVFSDEELLSLSLEIAKTRLTDGWYVNPHYEPVPGRTDAIEEFIGQLPDGDTKQRLSRELKTYQNNKKRHARECKEYDAFVEALQGNDGHASYLWLRDHSDGEYERVEIVYPEVMCPGDT